MAFNCIAASNTDTRKILDKAAAKASIDKGATAAFSVSGGSLNGLTGSFSVKGKKFCITTSNIIVWYDGKTQWLYNKKNQEVNVSTPKGEQNINPYTFLYLYKNGYEMSHTTSASGYTVHLIGKGKNISELYILVDKNYTLKQVKMQQGGKWTTINVSKFQRAKLSDNAFRFQAKDYPQAEVIDLR